MEKERCLLQMPAGLNLLNAVQSEAHLSPSGNNNTRYRKELDPEPNLCQTKKMHQTKPTLLRTYRFISLAFSLPRAILCYTRTLQIARLESDKCILKHFTRILQVELLTVRIKERLSSVDRDTS